MGFRSAAPHCTPNSFLFEHKKLHTTSVMEQDNQDHPNHCFEQVR